MERYIILSEERLQRLEAGVESLTRAVTTFPQKSVKVFDNDAMVELLGVTKRTLQNWRDQGKIGFSKIDRKIYYSLEDVETFLARHHFKAFANPKRD